MIGKHIDTETNSDMQTDVGCLLVVMKTTQYIKDGNG